MSYTIRNATPMDVPVIHQIAEITWQDAYRDILSPEQMRYMLDAVYGHETLTSLIESGEQQFILLEEAGVARGFAAYSPRREDEETFKLHKIYNLPESQGKGYGKILILSVIDAVEKSGKNILELNVNRHNRARYFYEKMGFYIAYEEDIPIGPYWMNDYVMRKNW